jgi:glycosyltransferase involved in cell wall biosynthesis
MNPFISVLITYHNERELLTECLESLFQHQHPDEVLVYDDASAFPAKYYVPQNRPVKIYRGEINRGPGFGRNQLLNLSTSEYVHFQDADDLFQPNWYEKVKLAIASTEADIVLTEITSVKEEQVVSERVLELHRLEEIGDLVKFGLMGSILVPSTTFRKDLALKIGGYRIREILPQSEDFDFHVRLAATGATFTATTEPLIIQRLRPHSHSRDKKLCWTSALTALRLLSQDLPLRYRQDLVEAIARVGTVLFTMAAYSEAKEAFYFARQLGTPKFPNRNLTYRLVAQFFNQEIAECLGSYYRYALGREKMQA